MPALLFYAAGAIVVSIGYRFLKKEWHRVNHELDDNERAAKVQQDGSVRTLRRDPSTGVWREE